MVSEQYGSGTTTMGAPPSNQHRIEMLEEGWGDLRFSITEQISAAVKSAFQEMQRVLIEQLTNSLEQSTQRLEERIAPSRQRQDVPMNLMKEEQEKFQDESRSTLSTLKSAEIVLRDGGETSYEFRSGKSRSGLILGDDTESGRPEGSLLGSSRFTEIGPGRAGKNGSGRGFAESGGHFQQGSFGGLNWKFKKLDINFSNIGKMNVRKFDPGGGTFDICQGETSRGEKNNKVQELLLLDVSLVLGLESDPEKYLWQSFDKPGNSFLPGSKFGWNLETGLQRYHSFWISEDDRAPGEYTNHSDRNGYPQLMLRKGSAIQFCAGPWNDVRFSGMPNLKPNPIYKSDFVFNDKELYYHYELVNGSVVMRMILHPLGYIQRWIWIEQLQIWQLYLIVQMDDCDRYALCSANGTCNINNSPACECLNGFQPKNQQEGNVADSSSGEPATEDIGDFTTELLKEDGVHLPSDLAEKKMGKIFDTLPVKVKKLGKDFVGEYKRMPAKIILWAKVFSYYEKQDSGLKTLEGALERAFSDKNYDIVCLLWSADPYRFRILIDCRWGGSHFFRGRGGVHYKELINYWILEGYLGRIDSIEKAYEAGHCVLMDLLDCRILKELEAGYVIMYKHELDLYALLQPGFGATTGLGLATVLNLERNVFCGRITHGDGIMKSVNTYEDGRYVSTLMRDGSQLIGEVSLDSFLDSKQKLRVRAFFNSTIRSLSSERKSLRVLIFRGCDIMDDVKEILDLENLTVLEVSGPSCVEILPDEFFDKMPNLQIPSLSELHIKSLPTSLYGCQKLNWLILRRCPKLESLGNMQKLIECKGLSFMHLQSGVAGYTAASFYCQLEGTNWARNLLLTRSLVCGPLFLTFCFLNTVAIAYNATAALPFGTIVVIVLIWLLVTSPLFQFPHFDLEDKVVLWEPGNAMTQGRTRPMTMHTHIPGEAQGQKGNLQIN